MVSFFRRDSPTHSAGRAKILNVVNKGKVGQSLNIIEKMTEI